MDLSNISIFHQPLSEEMKRELRRDSRRYKENKAKLRRQKDLLIQKRKNDMKAAGHNEQPVRKLKKITEGLPQIPKHDLDADAHGHLDSHSFSVTSFSSSRYGADTFNEPKRQKLSAFATLSMNNMPTPSNSLNSSSSSLNNIDPLTRSTPPIRNPAPSLTQSIVNKLPSIGHKLFGDTEELIMKNTIKPIKPPENLTTIAPPSIVNNIRSTPTQQQQQQQQQNIKKQSHPITSVSKS